MDLFDKIDQFEKLANEIVNQNDINDLQPADITEESSEERRAATKHRISKLASLVKRK